MKKAHCKKRRFLGLLLITIILTILAVLAIRIYKEQNYIMPNKVVVKDIEIDEEESLSFTITNHNRVAINCTAIMTITDSEISSNSSARLFLKIEKQIGVIKPEQIIKENFSGFVMPSGPIVWLHVTPDCNKPK